MLKALPTTNSEFTPTYQDDTRIPFVTDEPVGEKTEKKFAERVPTISSSGNDALATGVDVDRALVGHPISRKYEETDSISLSEADNEDTNVPTSAALRWSWKKSNDGRLRIEVHVPELSPDLIQASTLDVERRRIVLAIPGQRVLEVDVGGSDAEIEARGVLGKGREGEVRTMLRLKRERDFDVGGAEAEWRVGSEMVVIYV